MQEKILLVVGAVFAVAIFLGLIYFVYKRQNAGKSTKKPLGKSANNKKVQGIARRFAKQNSFRFIAPANSKQKDGATQLDAIVVGYFGVLGVISLGYNGQIYADAADETWLQVAPDGTRAKFLNPVGQASAAVRAVREVLLLEKCKKVPVDVVYVFAQEKAQIIAPRSLACMGLKEYKTLLKKDKFLQDCGLDLDQVENALKKHLV